MTANGRWYKDLDVFIERDGSDAICRIETDTHEIEGEQHADEIEGEQQLLEDNEDETYDGDREAKENEEEYDKSDKSDKKDEIDKIFEEDLEMFRNQNYEDEILDEDEVYPETEQSSDDEEEQAERMAKRGKLDGIFSLMHTFYIGEEFKQQVIKYILKTRRNGVFDRWVLMQW